MKRLSFVLILLCTLAMPMTAAAQSRRPAIPTDLLAAIARDGEANYLVLLRARPDLGPADAIADWNARGRFVYEALKGAADRSQAPLAEFLTAERSAGRVRQFQRFFSVNAIGVTSDARALQALAAFPQVEEIVAAPALTIPAPLPGTLQATIASIEWNIAKIRAPEAWAAGITGQGIVVASLDTGVEFNHPALVNQYRGNLGAGGFDHNYNWLDATLTLGCAAAPCDDNQHGTHTTGTMVGTDGGANQIGVAPGAKWIACKALSGAGVAIIFDLIECGDWMLAPRNLSGASPDPARRPHIVNNSWGFIFGGFPFLQTMVRNWRSAGIFPAFSAGNNGPACGTATSPGDYVESFATGATDIDDAIAVFSSRGRSLFGPVKPDVTAPGVNVRSAVPGGGYAAFSGTSMASPHTAGLVALLWSRFPNLVRDIAGTEKMLRPAADILNTNEGCSGDGPRTHPNNTFGSGRIDAVQTLSPFPVYANQSVYNVGDQFSVAFSLINRLPQAVLVDVYLGIDLPNGDRELTLLGSSASVPASFKLFDAVVYSAPLQPGVPSGSYRWVSLLVVPGGDPNNPADQLSVDFAPFTIP
jgi:subtilisin family serine protease